MPFQVVFSLTGVCVISDGFHSKGCVCHDTSLMCFFNRGDTEGTNSSKILCPMFVYVLFYVNLCHDLFCGLWIICGLMTCV